MKAFLNFFSGIYFNFSRWLVPLFSKEKQGAKFLIPLPVLIRFTNKQNILIIPMICSVMYQGNVGAKNIVAANTKLATTQHQSFQQPTAFENLISNLYANVNGVYSLADGNMVIYNDSYSNAVDGYDARKMTNWGENFGMLRDNIVLAVEKRKIMQNVDTVFYDMSNLRNIAYKLEILPSSLNHPGMVGFLEDNFLGTRVSLSLTETTRYLFNVTSTPASSARNRFRVIFFSLASGPLPVNFTSINAKKVQNKTTINWQVANEINIQDYQVERSVNGSFFTTVGNVNASSSNTVSASYQWIDEEISTGIKYYRVLSIDVAGNKKYSPIVVMNGSKNAAGFSILSNPVMGNDVKVLFSNKEKGDYSVRVFSGEGKMIYSGKTLHAEGTTTYSYGLPANTIGGNYFVEISDAKNSRQVLPVVILNQ